MVVKTIINLHKENNLYHHIWVTTYETLISFSIGTIIGCLIATMLRMDKKKAFLATLLGVVMASIIMMLVSYGVLANIF